MTALRKHIALGISFVVLAITLKVVFYHDSLITTTRLALSLTWLFILPGYVLLPHLSGMERIIIGTALGAAVTSTLSYYLGLLGISSALLSLFVPLIVFAAAFAWQFVYARVKGRIPQQLRA